MQQRAAPELALGTAVRGYSRAHQLGVQGVPFFVFDRRFAVSGAQSSDVLLDALERTWDSRPPAEVVAGDSCAIDGC